MFSSDAFHALCVLALTVTVGAQSATTTGTPTTQEPCAQVSAFSSQYKAASPSAPYVPVPPDMAYACQQSVPLVKEDTLAVLTGLKALVEWQSTLIWVKNPPANWPFAPADLVGGLQDLTEKVEDGTITQEIDFETRLVDLISAVHDGHLNYIPDAYSVFNYENLQLPIVSVSSDGKQLPEIYALADMLAQQAGAAEGWTPSPIVKVNGTEVVPYLSQMAFNGTMAHQDLDALYNRIFFSPLATADSDSGYFSAPFLSRFWGSSVAVEFKNGTQASFPITAVLLYDFTDVVDGESFYQTFCNATVKAMASASASATATAQPTATAAPDPEDALPFYPTAVAITDDGTLAGYFLDDEPSVAILAIHAMSNDGVSSQQTLAHFLQQCRQENKTHLIVDLSQNGGGLIELSYDIFKQLFPTIQPYLGAQLRAQEQVNILGEFYTPIVQQARQQGDLDTTDMTTPIFQGEYSTFDSSTFYNDSGLPFPSWADYYGPVQVHGDNFAHQYQLNLSDVGYDERTSSMIPFGYANNSKIAPQPFLSENMVIFGDGYCGSSCTILTHLLKYQGKVKSIVIGGRPQTGPMQGIGGTKGCQVLPLPNILTAVDVFYQNASADAITAANKTGLKDLADQGPTLLLRQDATIGAVEINLLNAIAQYDESQTPLQFVYEAADCRLWLQTAHITDVAAIWKTVAEQAWGLSGQEKYSLCVPGSTNQPSSLSGNQTLFQQGQPSNVTGYNPGGEDAEQDKSTENASGSLTFAAGSLSSMVFGILLAVVASSANLMI
ncbi:hypothetical protein AYL99_09131 [Fonsecaea erecta]|uniref:Uncharacterized protein n=1 Tax=Fonsecaea erecta TaxID=1367422 RepID=A0A178ZB66_9EURO|nr:hypothetical protein AYL99_09131 [Fonsecaea erecta]OAP57019.1 hypothetical protein AYL99_09131 [Fonsecaea erecta]